MVCTKWQSRAKGSKRILEDYYLGRNELSKKIINNKDLRITIYNKLSPKKHKQDHRRDIQYEQKGKDCFHRFR